MNQSLQDALDFVLEHEGKYVDHPKDPGGCTNFGITIATFRRYVDRKGTCVDLRRMEVEVAEGIYERVYWYAVQADILPVGVDLIAFDMGINAGPGRALKLLQRALGLVPDGIVGPKTRAALKHADLGALVDLYSAERMRYYRGLKNWPTFGKGWSRRAEAARMRAHGMIKASERVAA